jgi:uncharacterized protein (TIGR00369 family)
MLQIPPNCDVTLGLSRETTSEEGVIAWRMFADERFANPAGVIQGGFLSAFADSTMSTAVVLGLRGQKSNVMNVEMKISFVRAAKVGDSLLCKGRVIGGGTRVAFAEAEIFDGESRLVAKSSSTFVLSPRG